jgi:hypothetical protein
MMVLSVRYRTPARQLGFVARREKVKASPFLAPTRSRPELVAWVTEKLRFFTSLRTMVMAIARAVAAMVTSIDPKITLLVVHQDA